LNSTALCADGTCADGSMPVNGVCDSGSQSNSPDSPPSAGGSGSDPTSRRKSISGSGFVSAIGPTQSMNRRATTCATRRREGSDPCASISETAVKISCILQTHFSYLCNGVPDVEHMFDPQTSPCATISSVYPALGVVRHTVPGVGRCKVQNFGIAPNGLLPFGYMTDDSLGNSVINWRSPLNLYLDSSSNPVQVSSSGASIADTRCQQVANSVKAMGLRAASAKFYRYKSLSVFAYDPTTDQFSEKIFPGNQTMCELETKCNSDTVGAIAGKTALQLSQCTGNQSTKSGSFCGIRLDSSSLQDMTKSPLCYLDQYSYSQDACSKFGGVWDAIEAMQNPGSPYTCSVNSLFNGSQNCWKGCTNKSYVDTNSKITYTFYGECEAYDMCIINAPKAICTTSNSMSWMKFDWDYYALLPTSSDDGYCVLFYANKWSPWSDSGLDSSITNKSTCESKVVTLGGVSYTGQARPARSFRAGFLDTADACKAGVCPSQLWDPTSSCSSSQGSCSVPCGGCRALTNDEPRWYGLDASDSTFVAPFPYVSFAGGSRSTVCIDPTYKNATSCMAANGVDWSYKNAACYASSDAGSCSPPKYNLQCKDMKTGQCDNFTFVANDNKTVLLQCVFDRQMDCPDQASCEAATNGACDDGFLDTPPCLRGFLQLVPALSRSPKGTPTVTL